MYNDYICQRCYKSQDVLEALGKLDCVDGYYQCKDCGSDLEYESVVIRQIHFDRKDKEGIPYPKWLHDDLEKKGLLRKVDIGKYTSGVSESVKKILKQIKI